MAAAAPTISDDVVDYESRRRLAVGAVCSVLLHAAAAGVLFVQPGGFGGSLPSPLEVALPASEQPPEIQPGIEESRQVTINWLGFEDPTPHSATPAEIDQAALSPIASGVPDAAEVIEPAMELAEAVPEPELTEPAEPADAAEPVEVAEADDEAEAVETAVIVEAAAEPAEPEAEIAEETSASAETLAASEEGDAGDAAETEAAPILAVRRESTEQAASRLFRTLSRAASRARRAVLDAQIAQAAQIAQELQDLQTAMAAKAAQSTPASPAATPPPGEPRDAIASEKESDATSRQRIAEWEPGKPPAVEGLDITTVRPRWTVTTRMMSVPRNPVVRIEFRKNGTVARAAFLERQDTGYADVDGPLLDAIYAWTAKGRALEALAVDDPQAVVPITMRIVLIPGSGTIRNSGSNR